MRWPVALGTINDVQLIRDLIGPTYGFKHDDIVVLTDQKATRAGILCALEHLQTSAAKDDVVYAWRRGQLAAGPL